MKLIFLFSLFVWLSSAHEYEVDRPANLNCNCGWTNSKTDVTTYPWVVAILIKRYDYFICAGTILTKWHILTAADCIKNKIASEISVCIGSKFKTSCGIKIEVDDISIKSDYDSKKSINNLALILTSEEIIFNVNVGPACFPHDKILNNELADTELLFVGWGDSDKLEKIDFKVQTRDICEAITDHMREDIHICARSDKAQNVVGDGGSSYVMVDPDTRRFTVAGVLDSVPVEITNPPEPSLLTNFTVFRLWTKDRVSLKSNAVLCENTKIVITSTDRYASGWMWKS